MGKITIDGMVFFAHHGYFHEEREKGNRFIVDLDIETDLSKAAASDNLADTLNYEEVYNAVKEQMETRSMLLENITQRIADVLKKNFPEIGTLTVKVSKLNPPIKGMVDKVSVTIKQ